MFYTCPVCFYDRLLTPPQDYNICDCCGTEFGNDDEFRSYAELRATWINAGAPWFYGTAPVGWNRWTQIFKSFAPLPYASTVYLTGTDLTSTYAEAGMVPQTSQRCNTVVVDDEFLLAA
jgi:hypothetical protein